MSERQYPAWAEQIRSTYLRGESSVFLLHGNVFDLVLNDGELISVVEYLTKVLLAKKEVICHYNPSVGVKFLRKDQKVGNLDELIGQEDTSKVLQGLEKMLRTTDGVALILDYAEMLAPAGDTSFLSEADRKAQVTLHRWSLDRNFENSDNVVVLMTEQLAQISPKLVSNPRIATVEVELPTEQERRDLVRLIDRDATQQEVERVAALSAGLKAIQVRGILLPGEDSEEDQNLRETSILDALKKEGRHDTRVAHKLSRMTSGMTQQEALDYFENVEKLEVRFGEPDRYSEVLSLLDARKREILERECFGMVEFVRPDHDFSAVGGMEEVKRELMQIAENIRDGNTARVPMGLLFTGPMGTGKTFVAEAFAKSSGLTAIKLKNFRSKWVGSTEGNLEKILTVVKAIGNVLVIIDEGDRAFGSAGGDDGGTSSRVIARIKEFMSDTTNRGRVLFVLMSNRPDKLDIDIKRAGRLDRKIPFFYGDEPEDVEPILIAQLRRHKVAHELEFPRDRDAISAKLVRYSNADIEAVVLAANNEAAAAGEPVTAARMASALADYLPARDSTMLEYMELLAVFECSSRKLLPKRYAELNIEDLQERLRILKAQIR